MALAIVIPDTTRLPPAVKPALLMYWYAPSTSKLETVAALLLLNVTAYGCDFLTEAAGPAGAVEPSA